MATRKVVLDVCDLCGKDENEVDVKTHSITVDGKSVEAEACTECWWKAIKGIQPLAEAGRKPKAKKPRKKRAVVVEWPGSAWRFQSHALERMGQRHLAPMDVLTVAESPETSYPGKEPNTEVRMGSGLKVVVNPFELVILTASDRAVDELKAG